MIPEKIMKTKITLTITILAVCLVIFACKDNREAFLEEYLETAEEIVKIVNSTPTKEGVAKADQFLNTKKPSLKSKFDKGKSQGEMDEKTKERWLKVVDLQIRKLEDLATKHPTLKPELDKLTVNFSDFLMK